MNAMIFLLMRGDPLWQVAAGCAVLNLVLLPLYPAGMDPGAILLGEACGIATALAALGRPRATLFETALPLPARQLFLAKLFPALAFVWLPAACALAAIAVRWGPSSSLVPDVLRFATIATLGAVLPMSVRVADCSLPVWLAACLCAGVAGAGWAAWELLPMAGVLLLFGAASAAVFLKTWSVIPPSFQVAPVRANSAAVFPALPGVLPLAWRPILRSAKLRFAIPSFVLMALFEPSGIWFYYFAILVIQIHTKSRHGLRWLSTLPFSYRNLLLITLAVSMAPAVAGVVLGAGLGSANPLNIGEYVGSGPRVAAMANQPEVNMPLEFWQRAPGGEAPLVRAPWGETARPATLSILGVAFYNPYSAGGDHASHRFFEWQWERATLALHGRRISLSQYRDARKAGLPLVTDEIRFRVLSLSALLVYGLFVVLIGEIARWHRLRRPTERANRILLCGLLGLPVIVMMAADAFYLYRNATPVALPLIKAALLHAVQLLPNSVPLVAAVAAVPVFAMYWLLERQFRQSELLGPFTRPGASCSPNC
jgi:hypothetical protein